MRYIDSDDRDEREAAMQDARADALAELSAEERAEERTNRANRARKRRLASERRRTLRPGVRDNHDRDGYEW